MGCGREAEHSLAIWQFSIGFYLHEGGLGFRKLSIFNKALLAKQLWRFMDNPHSPVAALLKAKYFRRSSSLTCSINGQASWLWRSLIQSRPILQAGLRWRVGRGDNIRIWDDPWVPEAPNFKILTPRAPVHGIEKVSNLLQQGGFEWNVNILLHLFMPIDVERILAISLSPLLNRDKMIWQYDEKGLYIVKSGYQIARRLQSDVENHGAQGSLNQNDLWQVVWYSEVPPKVRVFLWKVVKDILPHKVNLQKRHISLQDNRCQVCQVSREDTLHLFRDCSYAHKIWNLSGISFDEGCLDQTQPLEWIKLCNKRMSATEWGKFLCFMYFLWWNRNRMLHGEACFQDNVFKEEALSFLQQHILSKQNVRTVEPMGLRDKWQTPSPGIWKINYDASIRDSVTSSGIIIRDSEGICIAWKTSTFLGHMAVKEAEAEAALAGIRFAHFLGGDRVILEGDNLSIYSTLRQTANCSENDPLYLVFKEFDMFRQEFSSCEISLVRRTGNKAADFLAGLHINAESIEGTIPLPLYHILNNDSYQND